MASASHPSMLVCRPLLLTDFSVISSQSTFFFFNSDSVAANQLHNKIHRFLLLSLRGQHAANHDGSVRRPHGVHVVSMSVCMPVGCLVTYLFSQKSRFFSECRGIVYVCFVLLTKQTSPFHGNCSSQYTLCTCFVQRLTLSLPSFLPFALPTLPSLPFFRRWLRSCELTRPRVVSSIA